MDRSLLRAALCTGLATVGLPAATWAQDSDGWDFYGQLNFGVLTSDNGFDTHSSFADNANSPSRIGLFYDRALAGGSQFRFNFETSFGATSTASVNGDDNSFDIDYDETRLRKLEGIVTIPGVGRLSFGQGSTATDGVAEADFSGTGVVIYSGIADLAGAQEFYDTSGDPSGISVGSVFGSFDGARRFRARYDTPQLNGFTFSISAGEEVLVDGDDNEYYDIGGRYLRDYGDMQVDARLGYSWRGGPVELLSGSLALLHEPSGFNVAFASGREQTGGDAEYGYVKLGLIRNWSAYGPTAFAVDYYDGSDFQVSGSESTAIGLGFVQTVEQYNLDLYAAWKRYEYDGGGSDLEDMDVTFVGARWTF
ncbi:porin [Sulfitobacter sp. D35]|uniref:porin n=1 Tax=Sulfitobacter sp. D35 TaxID=3083252 RepID=UPI00296EFD97|nr:porin [Sulfitobacter sp. D35]MDW4499719.1 porin [Sulfitobacter sp. D35]